MRPFFVLALVVGLSACQPATEQREDEMPAAEEPSAEADTTDAPAVDPEHYTVEMENDYVRVIRFQYEAGEESPMHSHAEGVTIFLSDGSATLTPEGGTSEEISFVAGDAQWHPAETHSVVTSTGGEGVIVEVRAPAEEVEIPETNATVVDPEHHEVEFENDQIRLVRMTYPAGYATPPHTHLPGVNIMLNDYKGTNTPEGGDPNEVAGEAGEVSWAEAGPPHVTENAGDEISLLRVEIKAAAGS